MKYLFETHAHTAEASPCSHVNASELICAYHDKGYHGVIITDHFGDWGFRNIIGSCHDKVDNLVSAYDIAQNIGEKLGTKVLFGMEIALNYPYRYYLVYGFDITTLYKYKYINKLKTDKLFEITQKENALLFAAHPFRSDKEIPNAKYLDGVEVFNGNPTQISNNDNALLFAKKRNLTMLAGSDCHEKGEI